MNIIYSKSFGNSQNRAYNGIMKQLEKDLANNKLQNRYNITVREVIANVKQQIGTAFIP